MTTKGLTRAAALGAITGSRSLLGPALLARANGHNGWALLLAPLAAGEIVGDKLPGIPPRTALLPLLGRLLMGSIVGAVAAGRGHRLGGAVVGSASAGATAFLATRARGLSKRFGVPNVVAGAGEDLAAIFLGLSAARRA